MDRATAAADLWARIAELVGTLDADAWGLPVPGCPGWDVHDLVGHLSGVQVAFDTGRRADPPAGWRPEPDLSPLDRRVEAGVAARRGWAPEALRAELDAARHGHPARLRAVRDWSSPAEGPVGATTEEGLFRVRMFDLWVHLQDLRAALGLPIEVQDRSAAAAAAHGYVVDLLPWMWVRRAGAPEGTTVRVVLGPPLDLDTVLEVRGGRGRRNPAADPGRSEVVGSPAGLTLLVAGRWSPEEAREAGALGWAGPAGEQLVAGARLF